MRLFSTPLHWEHFLLTGLSLLVSVLASLHVLFHKRDTRAAIGWIGLIWLSPFVGTLVYVVLGINRIERKARALRRDRPPRNALALACRAPIEMSGGWPQ